MTPGLSTVRWERRLLAMVVVASCLLTIWVLSSYLWDKYLIVRDVQNFYWMARAGDSTLFARDYIYLSSGAIIPVNIGNFQLLLYPLSLGYALFFYLASAVIDYIWLTKLSILILVIVCVVYLFKLGKLVRDNLTGVSLSMLFIFFMLASPQSISITTGLQRAFAVPLLIVFIYYMVAKQYWLAAITIFIGSLIYLPSVPPMILAYVFSFLNFKGTNISFDFSRSKWIPLLSMLALSAFVISFALMVQLGVLPSPPPVFDPPPANVVIQDNPAYQSKGSKALFYGFPFLGRAGIFDEGEDVANFFVLMIFSFLTYKVIGSESVRRMPPILGYILIAGFVMYVSSLFFIFGLSSFILYLPSRYTRVTLFLVPLVYVGLNWIDLLRLLPAWLLKNARLCVFFVVTLGLALGALYLFSPNRQLIQPSFWLLGLIAIGLLVPLGTSVLFWLIFMQPPKVDKSRIVYMSKWGAILIFGIGLVYLGTLYIKFFGVEPLNPSLHQRAIFQYVASLPKDVVLAGDPDILEGIPLFSKRSVLFRGLFPHSQAPFVEYFDAQYAESLQPMLEFCQRYQVDYVVLNQDKFTPQYLNRNDFFYQPWNDQIVARITGRSDFALLRVKPVFISGPFRVITCDAKTLRAGD